jgi:hypothetical protein
MVGWVTAHRETLVVSSYFVRPERCFSFTVKGYEQFQFVGYLHMNRTANIISSGNAKCYNFTMKSSVCETSVNDALLSLSQMYPIGSEITGFVQTCVFNQVSYSMLWTFTGLIVFLSMFCILLTIPSICAYVKERRDRRLNYLIIN